MELGSRISTEKYNPITGTPIPVHPTRPNTSAIFGGSPGNIDYMFIPPSATTRPTKPTTSTEKRRSLSRESLRRSIPTVTEGQPDSDECSSISDVSECSSEAEHRERTRTNSGSKTRRPITRSVSSRLPVSASKPCVMKRAHSFTRGTDSCAPRGQVSDSRGATNNQQEASSTADQSSQPLRPSVGGTSKIPRKPNTGSRIAVPQSSRIPLKRADVNSNVTERGTEKTGTEKTGKETTVNKRTAPADSKTRGIASTTSNKQASNEVKEPCKSEPTLSKQSVVSGIPVKGGKTQQHSGSSRLPHAKQDGCAPRVRDNTASKNTEQSQNIDKENDDLKGAMQDGKSTLKREGTGDELRVAKSDVTKSKFTRKSNIPRSNVAKTSQVKTRNNSSTEAAKTSQVTKTNGTSLSDKNAQSQHTARKDPSTRPAEANSLNTSSTLQRSDSGYGDTDSVSSKEDAPIAEPGNEFSLSRENSKSKIPIMSWKSRGTAKAQRETPSNDEKKPKEDTKKADDVQADGNELLLNAARKKLETETGVEKDIEISVTREEITSESEAGIPDKTFENNNKIDNSNTPSKDNLADGLGATNLVEVTSQTKSNDLPEPIKSGSFTKHGSLDTSASSNGKASIIQLNTNVQKSGLQIQDGESLMNNDGFNVRLVKNVSFEGKENTLKDSEEKQNGVENKENNKVDIEIEQGVSTRKQIETSRTKESTNNLKSLDGEILGNSALLKQTRNEVEKSSTDSLGNEQEVLVRKTSVKKSPKKPPRLSKVSVHDECETKQELSATEARQGNVEDLSSNAVMLNEDVSSVGDVVDKPGGGVGELEDVGQPEGVGVDENEEPPRRFDNCMQCRMEQSLADGEDMAMMENDPGFRQYPTFISPRKSLVMCKHHAKQKNDTEMSREIHEDPLVQMTSLPAVKTDQKSSIDSMQHKPGLNANILDTSSQESSTDIGKKSNMGEVKSPMDEKSRKISPKSYNAETLCNTTTNVIKDRSESLKSPKNATNDSYKVENKNLVGPKGSHSPLLALSRDKKFASSAKPPEDIKTALSLEWDDTGTELSPPNFSDEDSKQDIEDNRRPSVKLMDTNEALDKLKVIQSLIMKEAESRSRKEPEESAGKYAVGVKKTGTESVESEEKYTLGAKKPGDEVGNFGEKYGVSEYKKESTSSQVSPTLEAPGRKISSPTIWDRITDNNTISQDQTTELLNETLAKLKASPKLSSNAFARRTLSSRSLPGSRQASKEQLLSDGERPVYVYTSSWMNRSGKNSRGSSLSLCSANRSLPSSRQNLAKEPFNGLKRSESAAGRMEKDGGKRLEPKERNEFRLSDFDEINLSDDGMSELKGPKASTPKITAPGGEKSLGKDGETARKPIKRSKRRKKSKNTAATMNNMPGYGGSMDDLADGKTTCQCGGKSCVIS